MTEQQQKVILLAQDLEAKQKEVNELREQLELALQELGVGSYAQCQKTGTVYKVIKPKGTFTYFKDIDYSRTAIGDERAGTLSKKEAEEAGFVVPKKS